jgi:phosphatidylserine/phosphatidylglycerophosphate/cardiolipin synthase-like enzyme
MDSRPDLRVWFLVHIGRDSKDTTIEADLVARYAQRFVLENWLGQRLPQLYYDPRGLETFPSRRANFHPKCLLVDGQSALVTSANFTIAAQRRNIDSGPTAKLLSWTDRWESSPCRSFSERSLLTTTRCQDSCTTKA